MNKKIKIIELLNKIANGEEVPKNIRFHGLDFEFDELERCYIHNDNDLDMMIDGLKYSQLIDIAEIIEEQEEIDIQGIEKIRDYRTSDDDLYNDNFGDFRSTINELVQAVKKLDKDINYIDN